MNVGIIIYSQTGNTNLVALKLKEKLEEAGHTADVFRLLAEGEAKPGQKNIRILSLPDTGQYDFIVLGSPVQGFSLSPVMKSYLAQTESLSGKKVAFLITQFLRYPWLGGNRTVRELDKICKSKDAVVCSSAIVNWSSPLRERKIIECVDRLKNAVDESYVSG